jgi:hypothetical protein
MAPKFSKLIYQTFVETNGTLAFIGFPILKFDQMSSFRDGLRDEIINVTGLQYRTDYGVWQEIDVYFRFFKSEDADKVNAFYTRPYPGCLGQLFHTRYYKNYKEEESAVKHLVPIEINTSHDYPSIVIEESILSEEMIAKLIEATADHLKLIIERSNIPYRINEIMMSNQRY